jgi:hypothetical protein
MYNPETEVLFPGKAIGSLSSLRGDLWQNLVAEVMNKPVEAPEQTAFLLMMIKIGGCVTCNVDSFRAMRGCPACAQLNIKRFKGSDEDLIKMYQQMLQDAKNYLAKKLEVNDANSI